MRRAVRQLALLIGVVIVCIGTGIAFGQTERVAASTSDVALTFPEGATVTARFPEPAVVDDRISLIWRPSHGMTATVTPASIERSGDGDVVATAVLNFQRDFVPAGITIEYQWHTGTSPFRPISEPESFDWFDDRWEWQSDSSNGITVHTYGAGTSDAATILASATATLETMQSRYDAELDHPINIWAYPSMTDLAGTRQANAREAVAGVAYPEYGVISAILPADQPAELDRVIPHEVAHQVLAQATANPWNHPPLWFDEGLAVYLQTGGTTSYQLILERVANEGTYFGLDSLSYAFPYSPAEASLAYAQSWSVVSWLHERYGEGGVERLIAAFGTGVSWDEAIETALGTDIASLEVEWRAWIEEPVPTAGARLSSEDIRPPHAGSIASNTPIAQQENDQWPLRPANSIVQRSSIRRRSNASSRSTPTTSIPTAHISASSTIRSASPACASNASTAAPPIATSPRTTARCSSRTRAVSSAAPAGSCATSSTTSNGPILAAGMASSTASDSSGSEHDDSRERQPECIGQNDTYWHAHPSTATKRARWMCSGGSGWR